MKTLKDVRIGETVRVTKVGGEGALKRRIMDIPLNSSLLSGNNLPISGSAIAPSIASKVACSILE